MKRKVISLLMIVVMLLSLNSTPALAKEANVKKEKDVTSWYAPSTETTINGVPESQIVTIQDVIIGPYFESYDSNYVTEVDKFKVIGKFKRSNVYGTQVEPMTATVTSSTEQGSEWSGNVTFTGDIKVKVIAEIGLEIGGSYKSTRSTNEAVGYSTTHYIQPGKYGHIDLYYRGTKVGGALTTWTAWTGDMKKVYFTDYIYSTIYPSDYLDVFADAYDATY